MVCATPARNYFFIDVHIVLMKFQVFSWISSDLLLIIPQTAFSCRGSGGFGKGAGGRNAPPGGGVAGQNRSKNKHKIDGTFKNSILFVGF